jgi:hypothetical protein
MFAIDGVKLPSHASKARSGTRSDFERQAEKLEAAANNMLARHREEDARPVEPDRAAKEAKRIERLERDAREIRDWLATNPEDRREAKGSIRKSNRTDNESAKMATGKGVIQGYTGVAAVDAKHQVIVCAQAHGTGSEQELLVPVVAAMKDVLAHDSLITTDAGYHSEENLKQLAAMNVAALIADNAMRSRERSASPRKPGIRAHPIRSTTRPSPSRRPRPISPATSSTTPRPAPVCAQRESRSTATAATASPTATCRYDSAAPSATASPVRSAIAACARPRRPRRARWPSSMAKPRRHPNHTSIG